MVTSSRYLEKVLIAALQARRPADDHPLNVPRFRWRNRKIVS